MKNLFVKTRTPIAIIIAAAAAGFLVGNISHGLAIGVFIVSFAAIFF